MIIKRSVTLPKGFATWKEMVYSNVDRAKEDGFTIIFAGTEAGDDCKSHVIMELGSRESLKAFQEDNELAQKRIDAGADFESVVATPISSQSFSNFPS